jgi:2-aminoethylphosphonate-pyruvate transaminase
MQRDWGSRDGEFLAVTAFVRKALLQLAGGGSEHVAVPIQGSGTYALEATLGTLLGPLSRLLVLANGAYGLRLGRIAGRLGLAHAVAEVAESRPVGADVLNEALDKNPATTHVALVHCETSSGLLNPLADVAALCRSRGLRLIVDAMSSFGAIPLSAKALGLEAVVASANKCLEGAPGVAFAIIQRESLSHAKDQAPSLSLDLHAQWRGFEANGQWRFTPPTHVVAALAQALREHATEGGVRGRGRRYRKNWRVLVSGMRALGFTTFLPEALQAPTIVSFREPKGFDFAAFYRAMRARGFIIYPGKVTQAPTFRIGCMGQIDEADIARAVKAVAASLRVMGVKLKAR